MSAWIVSDSHITILVDYLTAHCNSYYHNGQRHEVKQKSRRQLAQILLNANYLSVNHRYSEQETPHLWQECAWAQSRLWKPVEIIKACHCLDYQSCERDDWKASEAYAMLQAIEGNAVGHLPGYDAAPWGIDEVKIKARAARA